MKMKLLIENWRKYLKEDEQLADLGKQITQIVADNQFLSHLAPKIDSNTIKDLGNTLLFVIL